MDVVLINLNNGDFKNRLGTTCSRPSWMFVGGAPRNKWNSNIYGKQIYGDGKATNGHVYELWRGGIQLLRRMYTTIQTNDEEIERHFGLERVRKVMEGFDREHSIDKIKGWYKR